MSGQLLSCMSALLWQYSRTKKNKYIQVTDYYGQCNTIKSKIMHNYIKFIDVFRSNAGDRDIIFFLSQEKPGYGKFVLNIWVEIRKQIFR